MLSLDLSAVPPLVVGAYIAVIPVVITIALTEWVGAMLVNAITNRVRRID